jgi:hypothetical protein
VEVARRETKADRTIQRRAIALEKDSLRELERRGEPVVLTGSIERWPARSKWTFAWFRATHGDVLAPVEWLKYHRAADGSAERVGKVEMMSLRDYVDALVAGDDTLFPRVEVSERLTERLFFMGPRGAFTQLHYDRANNLHAMIVGKKRWQLYAPDKARLLRPARYEFPYSILSEYDLTPDGGTPEHIPGGLQPDYDFILNEEEVLYLPYGWWHRVETLAPSLATNLWWWTWPLLTQHGPKLVLDLAKSAVVTRIKRYEQTTGGRKYRPGDAQPR